MTLADKVFKGSFLITIGEVSGQACSLLRNILLARLLSKADFGVAALLGMTVTIFELGGRLSIEHCIVQSKSGEQDRFLAVAHFIQATLGVASGLLLLIFAEPMAAFFKVPDAAWALKVLAVLPVLKGFNHLAVFRMTRELRFGPVVFIDVVPQIIITIAAWPLALIWNSYVVLVWLLVARQAGMMIASFAVADTPYRWAYDGSIFRAILTFGWPMMLNGVLLFAIMQGDRFAVGVAYSVVELGPYAIAGSVVLLPAAMLLKLSGNILLPVLSSAQGNDTLFRERFSNTAQLLALFSGGYALIMVVSGGPIVGVIFGPKYSDVGHLVAWLAVAQAMRLLRNLPTIAAMAKGDSKNLMISNFFRLSGLAIAFPVAATGASLTIIAACGAVGESIALAASLVRFSKVHQMPFRTYASPFGLAVIFIAVSLGLASSGLAEFASWAAVVVALLLAGVFVVLHLTLFSASRRLLAPRLPAFLQSWARSAV